MSKEKKHKWTVMVHLAGENNLAEECVYALKEMRKVGSDDDLAVVAQLNTGVHDHTELFIEQDETPGALNRRLKEERKKGLARAAARRKQTYLDTIFDFVGRCVEQHPAHRYMLVLSGHGSGTLGHFLGKRKEERAGETNTSVINMAQLVKKIRLGPLEGQRLDILGLDNCLMSMSEVAYMVHNNTMVMIGAEGFEPLAGWPYAAVLEAVREYARRPGGGG